jgi:hypothetical protein
LTPSTSSLVAQLRVAAGVPCVSSTASLSSESPKDQFGVKVPSADTPNIWAPSGSLLDLSCEKAKVRVADASSYSLVNGLQSSSTREDSIDDGLPEMRELVMRISDATGGMDDVGAIFKKLEDHGYNSPESLSTIDHQVAYLDLRLPVPFFAALRKELMRKELAASFLSQINALASCEHRDLSASSRCEANPTANGVEDKRPENGDSSRLLQSASTSALIAHQEAVRRAYDFRHDAVERHLQRYQRARDQKEQGRRLRISAARSELWDDPWRETVSSCPCPAIGKGERSSHPCDLPLPRRLREGADRAVSAAEVIRGGL